VVRVLRDLKKLRTPEDEPDSPAFVRDRTPLKKGEITTRALREEFRRDPALPMLVGDDVFVRGIRRGIEQGEYVYRRGDLLYGSGDPQAMIHVDEQSSVFTIGFASERGIWPRPKAPEPKPQGGTDASDGGGSVPPRTPPPIPLPADLVAEGVLKDALTQLWEKARGGKIPRLSAVQIRIFDSGDAFRLLGIVGTVPGGQKRVRLEGGYETAEGGSLQLEFSGSVTDAGVIKDFLDPQLRAAKEKTLTTTFELLFDPGLALSGDQPEKLTERLTRYAAGSAYVTATAQALVETAGITGS
jgi:hypothetical protein